MRLERHIGGMGLARQRRYLRLRGWLDDHDGWQHPQHSFAPQPLSRALHHQLTHDLTHALARWHWRVVSYSQRGYAQLLDRVSARQHSLPSALRIEARRQGQKVADFTYALFLAAVVDDAP